MIEWPEGKKFAFTIVDDTDRACLGNIKPVYNLLHQCGINTTKTVWVEPPRDGIPAQCLKDDDYLQFIREIKKRGFEIALHSVGSGSFSRYEILQALEKYREHLGGYPVMHINHKMNPDSIYSGYERFVPPLRWLFKLKLGGQKTSGNEKSF